MNLALTVTEVKALVLPDAGLQRVGDRRTSGVSDGGPAVRFGGPTSEAGRVVPRPARIALAEGIRGWTEQCR